MRYWLVIFALIGPLTSQAAIHGGSAACPQGPGFSDGCTGANTLGGVQHKNFFTSYALQSGQSYVTRPPWNVAGVDYPVGLPTNAVLKDPTNNANLPTHCTYSAGTNAVSCTSGAASPTFDSLDFSLHNCVKLTLNSNVTGTLTISNSKFVDGSACENGAGTALVNIQSGSTENVHIINSTFDGQAGTSAYTIFMANSIAITTTGTTTIEYCAFLNSAARAVEPNSAANVTYQYNYMETLYGNSAHAEFAITASGTGGTMAHFLTQFNTFLQPSTAIWKTPTNAAAAAGTNALSFAYLPPGAAVGDTVQDLTAPTAIASGTTLATLTFGVNGVATMSANATGPGIGSGDVLTFSPNVTALHSLSEVAGSTFTLSDILNNVVVANSVVNGTTTPSCSTLLEIAYATYTTVNWTSNYLDATGSLSHHFNQLASAPTIGTSNFSGNISLVTGSTVMTAYGQSGP